MGKGEITRYEQFLLFPQCFKRLVLQTQLDRLFALQTELKKKGSLSMLCIAPGAFIRRIRYVKNKVLSKVE